MGGSGGTEFTGEGVAMSFTYKVLFGIESGTIGGIYDIGHANVTLVKIAPDGTIVESETYGVSSEVSSK